MCNLCTNLRHCYFLIFRFWEVWMFARAGRRHGVGFSAVEMLVRLMRVAVCLARWFALEGLQFVPAAFLSDPHVTEVWIRIHFCGQRLLSATSRRQKFALFGIAPFHSSVLEPYFHLLGLTSEIWEPELFRKNVRVNVHGRLGYYAMIFTCESFSPSFEASFFLSGLLIYFCFWNIFSRALRWTSENTALRSIPRLGFPLAARGQENVPGIGTTADDATQQHRNRHILITVSPFEAAELYTWGLGQFFSPGAWFCRQFRTKVACSKSINIDWFIVLVLWNTMPFAWNATK